MVSKTLMLVVLFAVFVVVSEVAMASEKQSGTVSAESEETLYPDQTSYRADLPHGRAYGGCFKSSSHNHLMVVLWLLGFAICGF
ncbi:unnamed protein product [Thlaspi arvense]|uniref:Transmembrane protein n=1 Tax=Thlaspi arvense TaxID=13288 RepID=A0AAU9RRH4_THLAR|nr:unnamed protein product [Thlaspi arvense]